VAGFGYLRDLVASEPLVDLSTLDLSRSVISAAEIDRVLPQTGPMRMLDDVVWFDRKESLSVGIKRVRSDEFWVPHHIPGRPLLPGVLMIEAAAQLCSLVQTISLDLKGFLGFTRCDDTSFRGQVVPGDTLYLVVKLLEQNRRRFVSQAQGFVNGKLVFETRITGMTI
jgi:3-hydroxyacyl-[acyl-carrier-protein] dehydratase